MEKMVANRLDSLDRNLSKALDFMDLARKKVQDTQKTAADAAKQLGEAVAGDLRTRIGKILEGHSMSGRGGSSIGGF